MKVKNDTLFIGKVTEGKNGHVSSDFHTLGNVNNLSWNDTPDDTCRFILSEKAQRFIEEVETFSEVTCPLDWCWCSLRFHHPVSVSDHPEVVLLPVR